ncbi:spherulation-specific family 4 protein [Paraburkholderia acidisoli]|uniref:Spherulation-specific family 4 protein n=1 Tax=Paraburkholderia acidisoli TaxID=2571748 RepID=A0A7Z2GQV5_9BURK|nr:spherulation-specific family 4 protein [Paraburkholderia acidisoli]QGZ66085.1 hypothetical protein FAZ98_30170 [Paraburkholderia acidisoli]
MKVNRVVGAVLSSVLFCGAALGSGAAVAATSVATAVSAASTQVGLVVPSYFDAAKNVAGWNILTAAALKIPVSAILNPNNGPGTSQDANYVAAIKRLNVAGGKVLAYVSTSYSKRPLSAVVADINKYLAFYTVDGFFIDEMTSDALTAHIQYYQSIYNYIKGLKPTYTVMGNPGVNVPELYASLPTADRFVVFESDVRSYTSYKPLAWQASYPKSRFVHMVFNVNAAQLPGVVAYAKSHGAGGLYVTSLTGANPYLALPAYWTNEIAALLAP